MTGWAQVNGLRDATPSVDQIARRVEMDLWYINNWSLWLDIQILIKTFFEVLRKAQRILRRCCASLQPSKIGKPLVKN
jgi:lipopolysaccharide/colanic/teichoic acid biosynthesis glycosyltransferase